MSDSPSPRFSLAVPARKVVLLPDVLFFCRTVPVGEASTAADVEAQVELALEALSPFAPAQMYHGHHWRAGAKSVCIFAAYRKRFTAEQTGEWADAEAVLPAFAALLALQVKRPTTLLVSTEQGFTAINWDDAADVPSSVVTRTLPPDETGDATDVNRAALRKEVLAECGSGHELVEVEGAAVFEEKPGSDDFHFRAGKLEAVLAAEEMQRCDVRDKDELAALRRARARDMVLWRVFAGCAAALGLFLLLEFALVGGRYWQKARLAQSEALAPIVGKIVAADNVAGQINELSTKRMRPFEMLTVLTEKKPASVIFVSATVTDMYTMEVEARTAALADASTYRTALEASEACERVEVKPRASRDGMSTFNLVVTFRASALNWGPKS